MSSRLHFLCLSSDGKALARCAELSQEFHYSYLALPQPEELLLEKNRFDQVQFILIHAAHLESKEDVANLIKRVRQLHKESFLCVVLSSEATSEEIGFAKQASASLIFLEEDFYGTSRLEFLASQIIRASYVPVKLAEFPVGCVLDFSLYHLMPLNQKLLPILPKATTLTESRLKKLESIGEVFVRRDEVDRYRHYVEEHPDSSGSGLRSRCRAQYLSFCSSHSQLLFLILDQSETSSFKESKWLYERCEILARDLLTTLSAVGEAWEVVNNSAIGEFGSVERAPTVAAYAGLLSFLSSLGEPVDVMVATLLADVGMLELRPQITKKIRAAYDLSTLTSEELAEYHRHPVLSIDRCLERKLSLKPQIQEMILCSHEQIDGKGFPGQRPADKISMEAMLLQLSELIDRGAMVKMGQARTSVQDVRRRLVDQEMHEPHIFSMAFLEKLKPVL